MTLEEALAEIAKLKAKNDEILGEKKAEKAAVATLTAQVAELTKKAKDAEDDAEAKKAAAAGDFVKLEAQLKEKHAREIKERDDKIVSLEKARDQLVIDNALTAQLTEAKVAPQFAEAARLLLKNKGTEVRIEDGKFVGYVDGKPLADAVKEFAGSESGKHFVVADNGGGGAPGGAGKVELKGNPYDPKAPNYTQQAAIEKADPAKAQALREAAEGRKSAA